MATATRSKKDKAPFGYKADGTPRKRPVPTWINGVKKDDSATKKAVTVKRPTVKRTVKEQDSVTGTFQRGKRAKDGVIHPNEPKAGGGVRFEDMNGRGFSPVYLSQSDDALLGKPQQIRVTIKAL